MRCNSNDDDGGDDDYVDDDALSALTVPAQQDEPRRICPWSSKREAQSATPKYIARGNKEELAVLRH